MKNWLAALLLAAAPAFAQVSTVPPAASGGGTFTGGPITTSITGKNASDCGAPSFSFADNTGAGLCHLAVNDLAIFAGGFTAALRFQPQQVLAATGGQAAPSYSFGGDATTGFMLGGSAMIGASAGGTYGWAFDGNAPASLRTNSTYQFSWSTSTLNATNGQDTGLARAAAGVVKVTDGGAGNGTIRVGNGTSGAPAYSFSGSTANGMYLTGGSQLGLNGGGATGLIVGSSDSYFTGYTHIASIYQYLFSGTADPTTAADTGLARNSTSEVRVTDGSTGYGSVVASQLKSGSATENYAQMNSTGVRTQSDLQFAWSNSTTDSNATLDTGLRRGGAATVVEATDGSTGVGAFSASQYDSWSGANRTGSLWFRVSSAGTREDASRQFQWSNATNDASQAADTGLKRYAAGVVAATNGSTGLGYLMGGTNVSANTGTATPASTDSGLLYTNTGAGGATTVTLTNDPTVGTTFSVAVTVASQITVAPSAGETLYLNAASCANVTSSTIGAALSVVAATGGSGAIWIASGAGWTCN